MTNQCRGCGAEVLWIRMQTTRRKMPVDAEPVWIRKETGGDSFITKNGLIIFGKKVGDAFDDPDTELIECYESHFATCPVGGQFRNRQPRTRAPGYR